jgi:predicted nucleic acid-binding protein
MTMAILDTNVFVQAAIGSPQSASIRCLRAYDAGRFHLVFAQATLDELLI